MHQSKLLRHVWSFIDLLSFKQDLHEKSDANWWKYEPEKNNNMVLRGRLAPTFDPECTLYYIVIAVEGCLAKSKKYFKTIIKPKWNYFGFMAVFGKTRNNMSRLGRNSHSRLLCWILDNTNKPNLKHVWQFLGNLTDLTWASASRQHGRQRRSFIFVFILNVGDMSYDLRVGQHFQGYVYWCNEEL